MAIISAVSPAQPLSAAAYINKNHRLSSLRLVADISINEDSVKADDEWLQQFACFLYQNFEYNLVK